MAAILNQFELTPNPSVARSEFARRELQAARAANDLAERRALVDVMAVMDSVHASDDEIWMISYMDIMTLLLTLFVLLLAYSKITPESSVGALPVPAAVHVATQHARPRTQTVAHVVGKDVMPHKPISRFVVITLPKPIAQEAHAFAVQARVAPTSEESALKLPVGLAIGPESPVGGFTPPLQVMEKTDATLAQEHAATTAADARKKLLDKVQASALGKRIELTTDQDNVNLEISDNILFDPGSATLKPNGQQLLNELAGLLAAQDYSVSVEGHSDDVPFASARFPSNWELSATRATNVTRYLIAHGITAARLRAIGYADTHPRTDNTSVEGRARNRRVSLVLHMPVAAAARASGEERENTDQGTSHSGVNLSLTD